MEKIILKNQEEKRILHEINDVLNDNSYRYDSVMISANTPKILQKLGLKNLPILLSARHIRNCLHAKESNPHWHGLSKQNIIDLKEELKEPTIVMDSFTDAKSVVVVTNIIDKEKFPVVAVLKADGAGRYKLKTISSNYMTSVYGKDNIENLIIKAISNNMLLYANKEKIQNPRQGAKLQLLRAFHSDFEFNKIIHQSRVVVKESFREENKQSVLAKIRQYQNKSQEKKQSNQQKFDLER